jgi:hypothetical protein
LLAARQLDSRKAKGKEMESPKRKIVTRLVRRDQHHDASNIELWQTLSSAERAAAAWQIVKDVQKLQGKSEEHLRFQKSVARVVHRFKAEEPYDPSREC